MSVRLRGVSGAPGIAMGPCWLYAGAAPRSDDAAGRGGLLDPANIAATAAMQLHAIADRVRDGGRRHEAEIFEAQAMIAMDPTLLDDWQARIAAGQPAIDALRAATEAAAGILAALPDELLAARAADVRDVGARMERVALGVTMAMPDQPSVVVARDLPPSVTAEIPLQLLLGIALEAGSRTAHAAILARSLGIPCVVGVPDLVAIVRDRQGEATRPIELAVDGAAGDVLVQPSPVEVRELESRRAAAAELATALDGYGDGPARTLDGHHVALLANIGGPADSNRALLAGAEGVGLFRTEFLFMGRQEAPTEEEQVEAYGRVLRAFGPERPVVVRLADIGGDKGIPYLHLSHEENPFLGMRAIRLAYRDRALYMTQIRALSRAAAAAGVEPHLMAPMVATVADAELLQDLVRSAQADLAAEGRPAARRIVTGIMIEVPSAVLIAPELAAVVDFFSLGTNDLTQYLLAADRTNPELASMQDGLHPAVLRAIRLVTTAATVAGRPVAVCGELAGDPAAALILVGLGVDELSADAGSLRALRYELGRVSMADLERLAARALEARDAEAVRALAAELVASIAGAART